MLHLLATFSAGICAAGAVILAYRTFGRKAPRYLPPLLAALAMIGYNVWDEYTWAGRTIAALPAHIEVVETYGDSAPWKPWTYAFPETVRFVALDTASLRRNERLPGYVLAEFILVARRSPTAAVRQLFDCRGQRQADVLPTADFEAGGLPQDRDWTPVASDDTLFKAACAGSTAD